MAVKIKWLGVSGFEIHTENNLKLYIDPYLDRRAPFNPPPILSKDIREADAILITHGHFDHFEDTPTILRQTEAKLVASKELCNFAENNLKIPKDRLVPLNHDETTDIKTLKITATKAQHMRSLTVLQWLLDDFSVEPKSREEFISYYTKIFPEDLMKFATSVPAGPLQGYFILTESGFSIWNPTETLPIEDLKAYSSKLRTQIALMPVIGRFEREAAEIASWIKPRVLVVHTFDKMLAGQKRLTDLQLFQTVLKEKKIKTELLTPKPGENITFDLSWKREEG